MSLKQKSISGIIWSLLQNVGGRGITFIATIVLARLLTPEIFGLIGMLMIFIQISQTLVLAGFNQALIQKKHTDNEDYSSVFWINLVVSLFVYAILYIGAPWIAHFYEQPILNQLTRVFGLVFVINAFSYVQEARLTKEMRFKTLTLVNLPSTFLGGAVSIVMAYSGFGVWSLVALQLVTRLSYAVQIWIYARWKPLFSFNRSKTRTLFSFGGKLMVAQIINTAFKNSYLVVIGKFFPLASTGYYQYANNLVIYPAGTLTTAVKRVTFSAFSFIQEDNQKIKKNYKMVMQLLLFWICPAFVLAGVLATPLFSLVFTEKWLPAVPYFQLLCFVGVLWPINIFSMDIINVKGRSDLTLKLEISKKIIIGVSLIIALSYGIWAILIMQVINAFISFFINTYYSGRFIDYPVLNQIRDLIPILLLNLFVGLVVFFLDHILLCTAPDLVRLCFGIILGMLLYLTGAYVFHFKPFKEMLNILKSFKK